MPDKIRSDFFPEVKMFFVLVNLFNHINLLRGIFYVHFPHTAAKPRSSFDIVPWMDTSLFDQWITSHYTPNKCEIFISVARPFTIISALETLFLLCIYVGV